MQKLFEMLKIILISLAIVVPVRYFLVQPFFVRGASMEPAFSHGEYLIVDEASFYLRKPQRGEIIVFHFPRDRSQYYIKRIIGLPGERVRIEDGQITISDAAHPEFRLLDESAYWRGVTAGSVDAKLTENEYFVLGDNRSASSDSRSWGSLKSGQIVGRVWIRAFPLERMVVFAAP
jgi:signal peptidase I